LPKVLPVSKPFITSYSHHTAVLSIASTDEEYIPWFCSNYIQLCVTANPNFPADLDFFIPLKFEQNLPQCPFLDVQNIGMDFMDIAKMDIINLIKSSINNDYYIYIVLNSYYIPHYNSDNPMFHHSILIYGYDENNKVIHAGDFYQNGIYEFKDIRETDILNAFKNVDIKEFWWNGLKLIKRKKTTKNYELDIECIKELLTEYCYSIDSSKRYRSRYNEFVNPEYGEIKFGLGSVYSRLLFDLNILKEKEKGCYDARAIPVFAEHKKAMDLIIEHLISKKYLPGNENYKGILNEAMIVRNLFIRYKITEKRELLDSIYEKLVRLRDLESIVLKKIISQL
jgi:hypothetical protein